jgi:hypothetical protein
VDGLALCAGYRPGPAALNGGGAQVAGAKLVPAWDPLNADRRDAIYARLSWCNAAVPRAPCNGTKLLRVNGVLWAWAGWFDTGAFINNPQGTALPAVLTPNCSAGASATNVTATVGALVGDAGSEW